MNKHVLLVVPLLTCLPGCLAALNVDSWAKPCPYHADQVWEHIDGNLVHPVSSANLAKAEIPLLDAPILEVPPETAEHLVGEQLTPKEGTKFYLVRAVVLNEKNGGYSLFTRGDMLWVRHQCMGASPVWMKRRALVVQLRKEPREVYPDCGMTQ